MHAHGFTRSYVHPHKRVHTLTRAHALIHAHPNPPTDTSTAVDCSHIPNSNNNADPNVCACDENFYGTLTHNANDNVFEGTCTPCTAIEWSTGNVQCTSDANSDAGTNFACFNGFDYAAPDADHTAGRCLRMSPLSLSFLARFPFYELA